MRAHPIRRLALWSLCGLVLALGATPPSAEAKLDPKAWKELQERCEEVFAEPGQSAEKKEIAEALVAEASGKALRMLGDALLKECNNWWVVHRDLGLRSGEYSKLMLKVTNFTPEEEKALAKLREEVEEAEGKAKREREALDAVLAAVLSGPEALRKNILKRAPNGDWAYRAAALRIAGATIKEPESARLLNKILPHDKDHRVRSIGVDALATAEEGWENLVVGRLADPVWGIQLQAIRIITEREHHPAVPHLINALGVAKPRVQMALGAALKKLTGENHDAYADVWQKWWDDHKDDFESNPKMQKIRPSGAKDIEFYGLRIKSDRVLFIIDISGSMQKPTKNDNPAERWRPAAPTTGDGKQPPPPPPPPEILSGPKINVAKHELKKAIKGLNKETTFNIIAFNHVASQWKPTMTAATEKNKADAYKWMRALSAKGNTYIDGALRLGFRIAGLENFDKAYPDIYVDTIVLLSDGAPTDNAFQAKPMDPNIILEHVREWNARKHVVIHCVGVDMVEGIEFLKKLAAENGGTYVDR
jgi:uncharacterized protein YegL